LSISITGFDQIESVGVENYGASDQLLLYQQFSRIKGIGLQQGLSDGTTVGASLGLSGFHIGFILTDVEAGIEYAQSTTVDAFFVAGDEIMHHHAADAVVRVFDKV
jgi:hypothetical protein